MVLGVLGFFFEVEDDLGEVFEFDDSDDEEDISVVLGVFSFVFERDIDFLLIYFDFIFVIDLDLVVVLFSIEVLVWVSNGDVVDVVFFGVWYFSWKWKSFCCIDWFIFFVLEEDVIYDDVFCESLDVY